MSYAKNRDKLRLIHLAIAYKENCRQRDAIRKARQKVIKENLDFVNNLSHPDLMVKISAPDPTWISEYRERAVGYREYLFRNAMHGAAILEGARQANINLEDLGLIELDTKQLESIVQSVGKLTVLYTSLLNSKLPGDLQAKSMDYFAASIFGHGYSQNAISDMMRNLTVPEQSPFGISNLVRLSDPDFQKKYQSVNGIPAHHNRSKPTTSVVQAGGMPKIDEIAQTAAKERKDRLRRRNDHKHS